MKMQLDLAKSVAVIKQAEAQAKRAKKEAAVFGLFECGPAATLKLRSKGGDVTKLFKSEMCAIAHRYLATDLDGKLKVPALAAALQALITARPHALPAMALRPRRRRR